MTEPEKRYTTKKARDLCWDDLGYRIEKLKPGSDSVVAKRLEMRVQTVFVIGDEGETLAFWPEDYLCLTDPAFGV